MKAQLKRQFVEYLSTITDLDSEALALVYAHTKIVSFSKGQIISAAGEACKYAYFILSGEARSYYADFSGKTITWKFHFNEPVSNVKNLIIVDYKSFLNGEAASLTSETLTNVMAIQISKADLNFVLDHSIACERAMRKVSDQSFIVAYDRVFTLLTMSASLRYDKLLREEAHLLKMFSNHYIASYLGITPQSLSRIRRKSIS